MRVVGLGVASGDNQGLQVGGDNGRTMSPLISDLSSWPVRSVSMNCEGRVEVRVEVRVAVRVAVRERLGLRLGLALGPCRKLEGSLPY